MGPHGPRLVRIAHLTDVHLTSHSPTPAAVLRAWTRGLTDIGAEQLVVSGDLVHDPLDEQAMLDAKDILVERYAGRFVVVPGNHDIATFGRISPFDHVFPGDWPRVEPHGPIDFILFDSTRGLPDRERTAMERLFARGIGWTEGRIDLASLKALDASLRPDAVPVVVLHHHVSDHPPEPVLEAAPWLSDSTIGTMRPVQGAEALLRWARARRVGLILHGHKHRRNAWRHRGGILIANGGSSTQRDDHGHYRAFVFDVHTHGVQLYVATLKT